MLNVTPSSLDVATGSAPADAAASGQRAEQQHACGNRGTLANRWRVPPVEKPAHSGSPTAMAG